MEPQSTEKLSDKTTRKVHPAFYDEPKEFSRIFKRNVGSIGDSEETEIIVFGDGLVRLIYKSGVDRSMDHPSISRAIESVEDYVHGSQGWRTDHRKTVLSVLDNLRTDVRRRFGGIPHHHDRCSGLGIVGADDGGTQPCEVCDGRGYLLCSEDKHMAEAAIPKHQYLEFSGLAKKHGVTSSEMLRSAIDLVTLALDEQSEGRQLAIVDNRGGVQTVKQHISVNPKDHIERDYRLETCDECGYKWESGDTPVHDSDCETIGSSDLFEGDDQ